MFAERKFLESSKIIPWHCVTYFGRWTSEIRAGFDMWLGTLSKNQHSHWDFHQNHHFNDLQWENHHIIYQSSHWNSPKSPFQWENRDMIRPISSIFHGNCETSRLCVCWCRGVPTVATPLVTSVGIPKTKSRKAEKSKRSDSEISRWWHLWHMFFFWVCSFAG